MLTLKRLIPWNLPACMTLGTLTALLAVALWNPLPSAYGQDQETPPPRVVKSTEEPTEESPGKKEEPTREGRGEKSGSEPTPADQEAPMKEAPMKEVPKEGSPMKETPMKEAPKVETPIKEGGGTPPKTGVEGEQPAPGRTPPGRTLPGRPAPGRTIPGRPMPDKEDPKGGQGNLHGKIICDPPQSDCEICFTLVLPTINTPAGVLTATGIITLKLYQNGQVVEVLTSPVLNGKDGAHYCFSTNLADIPHVNPAAGGFDYVATANFTFGIATIPDSSAAIGTAPWGTIPGEHNDKPICGDAPPPGTGKVGCCNEKANLVYSENFQEIGEFKTEYERLNSLEQPLVPGTLAVTHVEALEKACRNWVLPEACGHTHDFSGNVLLVNGLTNQRPPVPATQVIWADKFPLPSIEGVKKAEYRVCFRYLPLPQCCFDIPARPHAVIEGALGPLTLNGDGDSEDGCGRLYVATFYATPGTSVILQILLDGNGMGDGNDLMIDNITVAQIVPIAPGIVTFDLDQHGVISGTFDVDLTIDPGLTGQTPPYTWTWELFYTGASNTLISLGPILTPNAASGTINLPVVNVTLDPSGKPIHYRVRLKVLSDCNELTTASRPADQSKSRLIDPPNDELSPEPVKNRKEAPTSQKRSE